MVTARGVGIVVAAAALVASLVGSAGVVPTRAGSSLLLAFGAVVALGLTRHSPR